MDKFYENYSIKIPPEDIPNVGGQEAESRTSNSGFLDKMLYAHDNLESLLYELFKVKEDNRRLKGENERLTRESAKLKEESLENQAAAAKACRKLIRLDELEEENRKLLENSQDNNQQSLNLVYSKDFFKKGFSAQDVNKLANALIELVEQKVKDKYLICKKTHVAAIYAILKSKDLFVGDSTDFVTFWGNILTRLKDGNRITNLLVKPKNISNTCGRDPFVNNSPISWNRLILEGNTSKTLSEANDIFKRFKSIYH